MKRRLVIAAALSMSPAIASAHMHDMTECMGPEPILSTADFDGSGRVTVSDLHAVLHRMWTMHGDDRYHPLYDMDADGDIDPHDVVHTVHDLGRSSSLRDQQLAQATQATMRYYGSQGLANALADGYLPFTPPLMGHGIHYARFDRVFLPFQHDVPTGLNFDEDGNLVALFYIRVVARRTGPFPAPLLADPADDFPPPVSFDGVMDMDWHIHNNVYWTGLGSTDPYDLTFEQSLPLSTIIPHVINLATGAPYLMFPSSDKLYSAKFYMLHAWPHSHNPCGIFGNTDPNVAPDAPTEEEGVPHQD